jgi:hypothetical protein
MQYIGRFRVQIMGRPYEFVFNQLMSQTELQGLLPHEHRTMEFRNDFISDMDTLDERARDLLRRELVKDQIVEITMMEDPLLEVDDIIELAPEDGFETGDRYYITSITKTLQRDTPAEMTIVAWKILDGALSETIDQLELAGAAV